MPESNELKKIKKMYGEKFMHFCRESFPTILEKKGLLTQILKKSFSTNSHTLYEDIQENYLVSEFKDYIFSKTKGETKQTKTVVETPYELLEKAGYDLYECTTEEEIQNFKKYYKPEEALCTFNGGRLNKCVVFWAVKKDVEKIKRENFKYPRREDEYGTSVMSIQFNKYGKCTVSIKNRYNHTVTYPDATYGNDLDKIILGLSNSFSKLLIQRGLKLESNNIETLEIPGYTIGPDGKYYKYNFEINGKYYCPGNIIIDHGNIVQLESESKVLIDYFILDKKNKTIELYDESIGDSFVDDLKNIEQIKVKKDLERKGVRIITIYKKGQDEPIIIEIDKNNQIVGYKNNGITKVGNFFLSRNMELKYLEMQRLTNAGYRFLYENEKLSKLETPNLITVGEGFLFKNKELSSLYVPNLTEVGNDFLFVNKKLNKIEISNLVQAGNCFLNNNNELIELKVPNLTSAGKGFLYNNEKLSQLEISSLITAGHGFLYHNINLYRLIVPKLKEVGNYFMYFNTNLHQLYAPNLTKNGPYFLNSNRELRQLEMPKSRLQRALMEIIYKNSSYDEKMYKNNVSKEDLER